MRNPSCQICELHAQANTVCVWGKGNPKADTMIVGEAPGFTEDRTGEPFVGPAGRLLDKMLKDAGFDPKDVYITNAVKCFPRQRGTPVNKHIKACSQYLAEEIAAVKPKRIIPLGSVALRAVTEEKSITDQRGNVLNHPSGAKVYPTFHPAFVLRQHHHVSTVVQDLRQVREGGKRLKDVRVPKYTVVETEKQYQEMLDQWMADGIAAYDVETSALEWWRPDTKILCLGVATKNSRWMIPERSLHLVRKIGFSSFNEAVAQNGKFDNIMLRAKLGQAPTLTYDTMLASHLIDENSPHDLGYLSREYASIQKMKMPPVENEKELWDYCIVDCVATLQVALALHKRLPKTQAKVLQEHVMPVSQAFEDVELNGVYISQRRLRTARAGLLSTANRLRKSLERKAKKKINWNSTQQLSKLLFEDMGYEPILQTSSGAESVSEEVLINIDDPFTDKIIEYKKTLKLLSFFTSWETMLQGGRLHPTYRVAGTVTGRPSCAEPNLQQVPRRIEVRSVITAPRGWTLLSMDYSQIELRIAAWLAKDQAMLDIFANDGDVHTETARDIVGTKNPSKEERTLAKGINFGLIYGAYAPTLRRTVKLDFGLDISLQEAQQFRKRFFVKYRGFPLWHEKVKRLVAVEGELISPIGRVRRVPQVFSPDHSMKAEGERMAINFGVQSFAVDIALSAMAEMNCKVSHEEFRIVGFVHDAILAEVKSEAVARLAPRLRQIMYHPPLIQKFGVKLTVPIKVDIEAGHWGVGKKLKD